MDSTLVFSHHSKIKCCLLLSDTALLLCCDDNLCLFNLETAQMQQACQFEQPLMPITMWISPSLKVLTIQGKMGFNFLFAVEGTGQSASLRQTSKYRSRICGFCKMTQLDQGRSIVGVSDEDRSLLVYDLEDGALQWQCYFEEQKYCDSLTYLLGSRQPSGSITLFCAQQGNNIYKYNVDFSKNDAALEPSQLASIPSSKQIQIINCMQLAQGRLYCTFRHDRNIYVISEETLALLHVAECKLSSPRELLLCEDWLVVADGNKLIKVKIADLSSLFEICELRQSKSIQNISAYGSVLVGCTEEKQFFYSQI